MIDAVVGCAYSLSCSEWSNIDYAGIFRISCISVRYCSPLVISLTFIDAMSDDLQPLNVQTGSYQISSRVVAAASFVLNLPTPPLACVQWKTLAESGMKVHFR